MAAHCYTNIFFKHLKIQIFMGTEELKKSKKCALQVTQVVFHSVFLWSVVLLIQCRVNGLELREERWIKTVWNSQEKESRLVPVFYSLIAIQTLSNCLLSIHSSMAFVRKGPFCSCTQPSQDAAHCMSAATGNKRHVKAWQNSLGSWWIKILTLQCKHNLSL